MNDVDRMAVPADSALRDERPGRGWLDDDALPETPPDVSAALVGLGFLGGAVRRGRRVWGALALLGCVAGLGLALASPVPAAASTTLLLTVGPEAQPGTAILDDQAVAQSRAVAALAVRKLGLQQDADAFLATYKAVVVTDRVMRITAQAPTSADAVTRANAITSTFLAFRGQQLQAEQNLQFAALDQQVAQAQQTVDAIFAKLGQLPPDPATTSGRRQLVQLQAARDRATHDLAVVIEQASGARAAARATTAQMVGESRVLDVASPAPAGSRWKGPVLFALAGFVLGLALGVGGVVVRALVSDRLRRRDDVALALGAPVRVSVPARRRPRRGGWTGATGDRDVQRVVALLNGVLPAGPHGRALAVVPVDDPAAAALCVLAAAVSWARQGTTVTVADLCDGAPAARLAGARGAGVHTVGAADAPVTVAVPSAADVLPVGPRGTSAAPDGDQVAADVSAACASADVLLTLVEIGPSVGSDHLATWADDAVVVVTAGRSSWTRVHAVGELVRLAGARLVAGVLVGADRWDESLGETLASRAERDVAPVTAPVTALGPGPELADDEALRRCAAAPR